MKVGEFEVPASCMTADSVGEVTNRLVQYFFTPEELRTCCLTGRSCNANKNKENGDEGKPQLNPTKVKAILGKTKCRKEDSAHIFFLNRRVGARMSYVGSARKNIPSRLGA